MPVTWTHRDVGHDVHLHVEDTGGTGRPVLLLHAWPLSSHSWSSQVAALQGAGYRVITYDRRGFGRSDKPLTGYSYDRLAADLHALIESLGVQDLSLVGFSMGGGEIARYVATHGVQRLRSVVFASAVTPYMLRTPGNPDGPLTMKKAAASTASLLKGRRAFFDQQVDEFFEVDGVSAASTATRRQALKYCEQSSFVATMACMAAWSGTDFRDDLNHVALPTLVIHGDADASVPFDGSARRTHRSIAGSRLYRIAGGPHGCNMTHAAEFNTALISFLDHDE